MDTSTYIHESGQVVELLRSELIPDALLLTDLEHSRAGRQTQVGHLTFPVALTIMGLGPEGNYQGNIPRDKSGGLTNYIWFSCLSICRHVESRMKNFDVDSRKFKG